MFTYDMRCGRGHVFEISGSDGVEQPDSCPLCGAAAERHWGASFSLGKRASAGVAREQMPNSWSGVHGGDPATVRGWREIAKSRERLEESNPELGGDRRPFLAHEGAFEHKPLRSGDPLPEAVSKFFDAGGAHSPQATQKSAAPDSSGPANQSNRS